MYRTTGGVPACLGQVKGLHDHSLPGECGVTMYQDRQDLLTVLVVAPVLAGAYGTFNHGIDYFQVGRVKGQGQMHGAAFRIYIR